MAKLTLSNLASLQNETSALATINANSDLIETALENTLSRDGTSPNAMGASLDMNNNRILNLPAPVADQEPLRLVDGQSIIDDAEEAKDEAVAALASFTDVWLGNQTGDPSTDLDLSALDGGELYFNTTTKRVRVYKLGTGWVDVAPFEDMVLIASYVVSAAASATAALTSENNAEDAASAALADKIAAAASAVAAASSASTAQVMRDQAAASAAAAAASALEASGYSDDAETAKLAAEAALDSFDDRYLGEKGSPPLLDNDGNALLTGALYYDSGSSTLKFYNGTLWITLTNAGLERVQDDIDPHLGNDLDLNGFDIIGVGNIDISGAIETIGNLSITGDMLAKSIRLLDTTSGAGILLDPDLGGVKRNSPQIRFRATSATNDKTGKLQMILSGDGPDHYFPFVNHDNIQVFRIFSTGNVQIPVLSGSGTWVTFSGPSLEDDAKWGLAGRLVLGNGIDFTLETIAGERAFWAAQLGHPTNGGAGHITFERGITVSPTAYSDYPPTDKVAFIMNRTAGNEARKVLYVKGMAGQTGRLIHVVNSDDALQFGVTNAGDVSAAGGISGSSLTAADNGGHIWNTRGGLYSSADGVLRLLDNAATSFGRLQFGGTTSSYPSLKRSAALLQARLADDSAYTDLEVADEAYGSGWNGSLEVPTKNAIYGKIESILDGQTFTGAIIVPDDAYAVGWNGSAEVPTKNALYDKIEDVLATTQPLDSDLTSWAGVTRASGFDTFVATPSSANLRSLITDETGTGLLYFQGGDLGTPSAGVGTNFTGIPLTGLVSDTTTALGVGSINLGHASDTTLTRVSAGKIAVEGSNVLIESGNAHKKAIIITIDGGGATITTGIKGDVSVPWACTITKVRTLLDQSGSIVVDLWKDTYANYPPTDADSITSSTPPTVSAAVKSEDSTLTSWTTSIAAGDTIRWNVDSITTATRCVIIVEVTLTQ